MNRQRASYSKGGNMASMEQIKGSCNVHNLIL